MRIKEGEEKETEKEKKMYHKLENLAKHSFRLDENQSEEEKEEVKSLLGFLRNPEHLAQYREHYRAKNKTLLILDFSPGTTATRGFYSEMCYLGVDAVHYHKQCYPTLGFDDAKEGNPVNFLLHTYWNIRKFHHQMNKCTHPAF